MDLQTRRSNNQEKCAGCGWFIGGKASAGRCELHSITVLDLSVCSDWRDGDVVQEVLKPEDK